MSQNIQNFLQRIKEVNKPYRIARHGRRNGKPIFDEVSAGLTTLSGFDTAEAGKLAQLEVDARATGDQGRTARRALHALRIITVQNYMMASGLFLPRFAESVSLGDDEQARFQRTTMEEVRITRLASATKSDQKSILRNELVSDQAFIQLYRLVSDRVTGPIYDIQRGMLDSALLTVDIAADMTARVDNEIKTLLLSNEGDGSLGFFNNFNFSTGAKADRTLFLHSSVNVANLPLRNYCNLINTSHILDVCNAAMRYCGSFGSGALRGGDLKPTGDIVMASSEVTRYVEQLATTAFGSQISDLENKIQAEGYVSFTYLGLRWNLVPDVTLAKGVCYPVLSKPACYAFFKPGLDAKTQPEDTIDMDINEQGRAGATHLGAYFEETHRINLIKVGFTAANSGAATSLFV